MTDQQHAEQQLKDGASWHAFCDALKQSGTQVLRTETPADAFNRAEGYRYLTRLLTACVTRLMSTSKSCWQTSTSRSLSLSARTGMRKSARRKFQTFRKRLRLLTQRRVSDIIAELDMLGIINAKVISKGRYGRTREICLAIPPSTVPKINQMLREGLNL